MRQGRSNSTGPVLGSRRPLIVHGAAEVAHRLAQRLALLAGLAAHPLGRLEDRRSVPGDQAAIGDVDPGRRREWPRRDGSVVAAWC
jgi:hypothetical protein